MANARTGFFVAIARHRVKTGRDLRPLAHDVSQSNMAEPRNHAKYEALIAGCHALAPIPERNVAPMLIVAPRSRATG